MTTNTRTLTVLPDLHSAMDPADIAAIEARMGEILSRYEGEGSEVELVFLGGDVVDDGITSEMREMAAGAYLDAHRFEDETDRILDRVGDDVDALYPDSDELQAQGVDTVALAEAMQAGEISPTDVVEALPRFTRS